MKRVWFALALSLVWVVCAWAEEPVQFGDARLKEAVEDALWVSDPTPSDMLELTELDAGSMEIESLVGLEYATNLTSVELTFNHISDISPLSGLSNLTEIVLNNNQISDISVVAGLPDLVHLDIHNNEISDISAVSGLSGLHTVILRINRISDISPLSGLLDLEYLDLRNNQISDISSLSGLSKLRIVDLWSNEIIDISPLCGLTCLDSLELGNNPLNQDACDSYIPQIIANNPGLRISHRPCTPLCISVTASPGGRVTAPGEGKYVVDYGDIVCLEAQADPGFRFVGWSGSYFSTQPSVCITADQDYEIRANFETTAAELYVDDDAPDDPKPGDPHISDPDEIGTPEHPIDSIQEALDVATNGATVFVYPGVYRENINLLGKKIHLVAVDPADPHAGPCAVIEGTGAGPVVRIGSGSGSDCSLTGFVITKGRGNPAGGIDCSYSSPTLQNCLIVGNRCTNPNGGALYFYDSKAVLINCTIADNYGGEDGAALMLVDSDITMTDSIVWDNRPNEISPQGTSVPLIQYCCVRGWWPDTGNTHTDPLFARRGHWAGPTDPNQVLGWDDSQGVWVDGDYHLRSQAGRWEPLTGLWVSDEVTSPAIDAGDRTSPVGHEPSPNGDRINMGAYGGTTEASKSH